ncbi:MAG: hypothetical protein IPP48_16445 [Chitinophagaceae bacterium]|nr:hypothetical protein [Chitinophagaceae bacterium]
MDNSFFEDSKHNLWLCTLDGLFKIATGSTEALPVGAINNELVLKNLSSSIESITEDQQGAFWFTADNTRDRKACVGKYDDINAKLSIFYNEMDDKRAALATVDLRDIICDNIGNVYVSNYGLGLIIFPTTASKPNIRYLSKEQGINSNYINYLTKDNNGNIWCSTALGISCYKPDKKLFVNFNYITQGIENTYDAPLYFSSNTRNLYISQNNAIRVCNTEASTLSFGKSNLLISNFLFLINRTGRVILIFLQMM